MNAAVRRLRTDRKAVAAVRAYTGILGSLLPKRIIKARAVKGKRGNNMATPEWNLTKATTSATESRFVTRARLSFCCAWSLVGAG